MLMKMNESFEGVVDVNPADVGKFTSAGWIPVDGKPEEHAENADAQCKAAKSKRRTPAKKTQIAE